MSCQGCEVNVLCFTGSQNNRCLFLQELWEGTEKKRGGKLTHHLLQKGDWLPRLGLFKCMLRESAMSSILERSINKRNTFMHVPRRQANLCKRSLAQIQSSTTKISKPQNWISSSYASTLFRSIYITRKRAKGMLMRRGFEPLPFRTSVLEEP